MDSARETIRHFTQDWAGPHRDTRHDFTRSLESITLPLKRIHLKFHHPRGAYPDQRNTLPNLVLPQPYDPFSSSLQVLSYHLETMILRAAVDQTLFWPLLLLAEIEVPECLFLSLQRVREMVFPRTPGRRVRHFAKLPNHRSTL